MKLNNKIEDLEIFNISEEVFKKAILKLLYIKYKNKDKSKKDIFIVNIKDDYNLLCYGGKFIGKSERDDKEKQCSVYLNFTCFLYKYTLINRINSYYIGRNYYNEFYFTNKSEIKISKINENRI